MLRGANINIVVIHQQITGEYAGVMLLYQWGLGSTTELANGLKVALAKSAK